GEQRTIRDDVDEPRNPLRAAIELAQRALREDRRLAARDAQPMPHVLRRLRARQRLEVVAARDALRDLAHLRTRQEIAQLRLADQDDLQQLLRRRLEVRQEAYLLEQLGTERLRLVDDQHDAAALGVRLQEVAVQRGDQLSRRGFLRIWDAQLLADVLEKIPRRELRIEDQRDLGLLGKLLEEAADQRRLARADLAGELDEAAAFGDAVDQMSERVGMPAAQVEVPRIRRDRERFLVEPEEFRVHVVGSEARRRAGAPLIARES